MKRIASFFAILVLASLGVTAGLGLLCWMLRDRSVPPVWQTPSILSGIALWATLVTVPALGVIASVVFLARARSRRRARTAAVCVLLWIATAVLWGRSYRGDALGVSWSSGPAVTTFGTMDSRITRVNRASATCYAFLGHGITGASQVGDVLNVYHTTGDHTFYAGSIEVVSLGPGKIGECRILYVEAGKSIVERDGVSEGFSPAGLGTRIYLYGASGQPGPNVPTDPDLAKVTRLVRDAGGQLVGAMERAHIVIFPSPEPAPSGQQSKPDQAALALARARCEVLGLTIVSPDQILRGFGNAEDTGRKEPGVPPVSPGPRRVRIRSASVESKSGGLRITVREVPGYRPWPGATFLWGLPIAPASPKRAVGTSEGSLGNRLGFDSTNVSSSLNIGPRFGRVESRSVTIPYWLITTLLALPPLAWLLRRTIWWHVAPPGHCKNCGYDLRASRDRCPECGRSVARTEMSTTMRERDAAPTSE